MPTKTKSKPRSVGVIALLHSGEMVVPVKMKKKVQKAISDYNRKHKSKIQIPVKK